MSISKAATVSYITTYEHWISSIRILFEVIPLFFMSQVGKWCVCQGIIFGGDAIASYIKKNMTVIIK